MGRIGRLGSRIYRDEEGQSLVFGAITAFTLVAFVALSFNVGMVISKRVRAQNAADAAAYSGALVEANSLSAIAWLNDGMAYTYYKLMRITVDYVVFDTLKGFKDCNPAADDLVAAGTFLFPGVDMRYQQAKLRYEEWVSSGFGDNAPDGKGKAWLKRMARLSRGIAAATPALIKQEVWGTALANGVDLVTMYPEPEGRWGDGFMVFQGGGETPLFEEDSQIDFTVMNATKRIGEDELPYWGGTMGGKATWFNPLTGNLLYDGAYHQTRVCWNPKDLEHTSIPPHIEAFTERKDYTKFLRPFAPNGHWHEEHFHSISEFPYFLFHGDGHRFTSQEHTQTNDPPYDHHADEVCGLCDANDWASGDGASDVRVWPFASSPRQNRFQEKSLVDIIDQEMLEVGMPLVVTSQGLKVGINVGVYRRAGTPMLDTVFSDPEWGYFALASAHVGLDQGGRINDELAGFVAGFERNLYTEVKWGAKLVTMKKDNVYLGNPVDQLWSKIAQSKWRKDPLIPVGDPSVSLALARMTQPSSGSPFSYSNELEDVATH